MTRRALLLVLVFAASGAATAVAAEPWPRFRGPNADGVSADDPRLPETWGTETAAWVVELPGYAWSNPVIWGDRVFVTTVSSDETSEENQPKAGLFLGEGVREPEPGVHHWLVYCFDLHTGEKLWEREAHVGEPTVPRHPKASYASETPTTDGERLYVLFGDLGVYCYSLDGKPLWTHAIEPKKTFYDYGTAA